MRTWYQLLLLFTNSTRNVMYLHIEFETSVVCSIHQLYVRFTVYPRDVHNYLKNIYTLPVFSAHVKFGSLDFTRINQHCVSETAIHHSGLSAAVRYLALGRLYPPLFVIPSSYMGDAHIDARFQDLSNNKGCLLRLVLISIIYLTNQTLVDY